MNEELFNEASKSNILSKQLVDKLQESMTYSSISFINWTIEVLKLLKARIERGDKIKDETTGVIYDLYTFRQFVETNFSAYITGQAQGGSHAWNLAWQDGTPCWIDTTWGDSGPAPNYDYFAMTAEESWQHHSW